MGTGVAGTLVAMVYPPDGDGVDGRTAAVVAVADRVGVRVAVNGTVVGIGAVGSGGDVAVGGAATWAWTGWVGAAAGTASVGNGVTVGGSATGALAGG